MCRRQGDLPHVLVRAEDQGAAGGTPRHGVDGEPGLLRPSDRRGGADATPPPDRPADCGRRHLPVPGQCADVAQRRGVRDPPQDHGGPEEREEPVRCRTPAAARLGEVLEAGQHEEPLPGPLADHGGEVGQGRDVGHFVEGEKRGWAAALVAGPGVGGVAHVADGCHHEGSELPLPTSGRTDVQRVRAVAECLEVEGRQTRRSQDTLGAVGREHTRCGGPDARLLPGVGGYDPGQQVGRRCILSGPRGQNFERRGAVVAIDPMEHVRHGEPLECRGMDQGRQESSRTLAPVVFARA